MASWCAPAPGAMTNSATWPLFKAGFGPAWDQMFVQSNFGVVTKAGFWLMPEPEATLSMRMALPQPEDIGWLTEVLTPLRLSGVIPHNVGIPGYMGAATTTSQRREWYEGKGALPDEVVAAMMRKTGAGWWNLSLKLHGLPEVNEAHRALIEKTFAAHTDRKFEITRWKRGDTGPGGAPHRVSSRCRS